MNPVHDDWTCSKVWGHNNLARHSSIIKKTNSYNWGQVLSAPPILPPMDESDEEWQNSIRISTLYDI